MAEFPTIEFVHRRTSLPVFGIGSIVSSRTAVSFWNGSSATVPRPQTGHFRLHATYHTQVDRRRSHGIPASIMTSKHRACSGTFSVRKGQSSTTRSIDVDPWSSGLANSHYDGAMTCLQNENFWSQSSNPVISHIPLILTVESIRFRPQSVMKES